ncbi:ABC transporter ATP-binding protein, partial [Listeria monocytogenes]|nr:ABC transporter ATP-binding protein [Listeria monocytogenes]
MIKLVKRMSLWSVFAAVVFMIVQIIADLYLPTLTSNIINDGV